MNWKLLAVCLLIATSGCIIPEPFGVQPDVKFSGEIDAEDDQFHMQGDIIQRSGDETLNDVAVCGYTEEHDLLFAEQVPPFESREPIEITAEDRPKYVLIYSEEFWDADILSDDTIEAVQYYELRQDGIYSTNWASSSEELPIDTDRPLQNGCPA